MDINISQVYMIMARKNMSQSDIARKSGISRQHISTVLIRKSCTPRTLGKIAIALGVPPSEITSMEDNINE